MNKLGVFLLLILGLNHSAIAGNLEDKICNLAVKEFMSKQLNEQTRATVDESGFTCEIDGDYINIQVNQGPLYVYEVGVKFFDVFVD